MELKLKLSAYLDYIEITETLLKRLNMAPFRKKLITFLKTIFFFLCSIILLLSTRNTFFVQLQLFFCNIKYIFEQHQLAFVDTRLLFLQHQAFFSTQNCFSCKTKFLFCTLSRMLYHSDMFSLSHSNKNIVTCQKK